MRLPRHATTLSLPALPPREALAGDEALLDEALSSGHAPLVRWWLASAPAIVIGLGLRQRLSEVVDLEACRAASVEIVERKAGGGAVYLDPHVLCGAVCVPASAIPSDVTESYCWAGSALE